MEHLLVYSLFAFVVLSYDIVQGQIPPPDFTLESYTPDSFVIRFSRAGIPGTVTVWRVQYRQASAKKKNLNIDGVHDEHVIGGLNPDSQYKVRIMANTDQGKGKYSEWIGVRTLSESAVVAPEPVATIPDKPQNIQVVASGTTGRLTWDPPVDNGAEVIGYVVSYGPSDNARENVFTLRPSPTHYDLEGLTANVQYMVSITAYNTNGQSYPANADFVASSGAVEPTGPAAEPTQPVPEPTKPVAVPTEPEVEPEPEIIRAAPPQPENVRYESINPTTIRVTWTLPDTTSSGVIENIRFGFGDAGTRVEYLPSSSLGKDVTSYTAEALQPGTQYTVMVITENRYGQSDPVTLMVETIAAPGPVVDTSPSDQDCPISVVECYHQYEGRLVNLNPNDPTFCAILTRYADCLYGLPQSFRQARCYGMLIAPLTNAYSFCSIPAEHLWYSDPTRDVVPPPRGLEAIVITPTSVRISFEDPSFGQIQEVTNDRYYTLRYKVSSDQGYEYANIRQTTYTLEYLRPETHYTFEVMVVLSQSLQSEYSVAYAFTRDPSRQDMVRGVTAIQVKVTSPGVLSAVINWIPPNNEQRPIRGYVLEMAAGIDLTPSSTWERMETSDPIPSYVVEPLSANTTYHIKVAPRYGSQVGDYSDPPEVFLTPTVPPSGQPLHMCSSTQTTEQVVERVTWMRDGGGDIARPALVGVPLPYCDDYYGIHECHGLVCFCIPGKRPQSDSVCRSGGYQGDQPPVPDAPCQAEYDAGRQALAEARKAGKTLSGVHLPLCNQDGYYQPKQCLGSVCYCSTLEGDHTGKEVPVWDANSLQCCE